MNINDRLENLSKEELIVIIKEIKLVCESNKPLNLRGVLGFILRLIKGDFGKKVEK